MKKPNLQKLATAFDKAIIGSTLITSCALAMDISADISDKKAQERIRVEAAVLSQTLIAYTIRNLSRKN